MEEKKYENIMWIDDLDTQDSEESDLEAELNGNDEENSNQIIKDYFGNFFEYVTLIETIDDFLEKIKDNIRNYDLVIFDIDMNQGIINFETIEEELNSNHIDIPDFYEFEKQAGIYILLFLLTKGFPLERMALLTGNGTESTKKMLNDSHITKFDDLIFEKNNVKFKFIPWLKDKYDKNSNNSYYRVRRLVYQACDYWEKIIRNYEKVPFNELYGLDNEKESFIDMLKQIKMMFSVIKPDNPEEIYYQVMHIVSMFHEEKANIDKIKNGIKPYHQMIRNFRNWSSHNKFENHNLSADQFAFLFCIALRTYFDTQKNEVENNGKKEVQYYLNKDIYYYEDMYFDKNDDIYSKSSDVYSKIEKYWNKMLNKVYFYGGRVKRENLLKDVNLSTLLQRLGEQEPKMPFYYINLSMFKSPFESTTKPEQDKNPVEFSDNNVSVKFNYKIKPIDKENILQFEQDHQANSFFEKIAFSLLPDIS